MRLRTSTTDFHRHYFELSPQGSGVTTLDLGHRHQIESFKILTEDNHTHEILGHKYIRTQGTHVLESSKPNLPSSKNLRKMFSSAVSKVEERASNIDDIPLPRVYPGHRRAEAIRKALEMLKTSKTDERATNVYGEVPMDRKYGDHRRLAAIKAIKDMKSTSK